MKYGEQSYSSTGNSFRSSDYQRSLLDSFQQHSQDFQQSYVQNVSFPSRNSPYNNQGLLMIQNPREEEYDDYSDLSLQMNANNLSLGDGSFHQPNYDQRRQITNLDYGQRNYFDVETLRGHHFTAPGTGYDFVEPTENASQSFHAAHSTPMRFRSQNPGGDATGFPYPQCQFSGEVGLSPVMPVRNSNSDASSNSWQRQNSNFRLEDNSYNNHLHPQLNLEQHNTVNNYVNYNNYVFYCSHDRPENCQHPCGASVKEESLTSAAVHSTSGPMTPTSTTSPPPLGSTEDIQELQEFSRLFKQRRISLGYTQAEVGEAMGKLYGSIFSQTTICRFEALQLSLRNMNKLKPFVEKWLENAEKNSSGSTDNAEEGSTFESTESSNPTDNSNSENVQTFAVKQRKRRTSIDNVTKKLLEEEFKRNDKPSQKDIKRIADTYSLEKETVRVWFCNRRQREKKLRKGIPDNTSLNTVANALQRANACRNIQ